MAYSNVTVKYDTSFDIEAMAEDIRVPDTPYLIVLHIFGKDRVLHWHIVCQMRPKLKGVERHLLWCPQHPHKKIVHANGKGKNPISAKHNGDDGWFAYSLKPKEWNDNPDLIVDTNLSDEEIQRYAKQSAEYHEMKKAQPLTTVQNNPRSPHNEAFYPYLVRIIGIHYKAAVLTSTNDAPNMWGPGTTEALVAAIAKTYPEFIHDIASSKARAYAPHTRWGS